MKKFFAIATILTALVVATALCAGATELTPGQVKAVSMVDKAVAYYKANGDEKAFDAFGKKGGEFYEGEFYIFVISFDGIMLANGANNALVGNQNITLKDADGKLMIKEMIDTARDKKTGWVDYKWRNPKTGEVRNKSSYVRSIGDALIACGVYK
jgi:signal transduction histidine kinase